MRRTRLTPEDTAMRVAAYEGYRTLRFERRGRVLRVTIDRPEALNAVDDDMHEDLSRVFDEINRDEGCDVVIAADSAVIGDPHVRMGFVAGDGGAVIWPQLIGFARAKELLMTGEMVPAERAERLGLVNYVVPAAELDARVDAMADRLASG